MVKLVETRNKREVDGFYTAAQEEAREELLASALSPVVGGVITTRETLFVLSDIPSTPQLWAELQIFKWIPSERKDYTTRGAAGMRESSFASAPISQPSHPPEHRLHVNGTAVETFAKKKTG